MFRSLLGDTPPTWSLFSCNVSFDEFGLEAKMWAAAQVTGKPRCSNSSDLQFGFSGVHPIACTYSFRMLCLSGPSVERIRTGVKRSPLLSGALKQIFAMLSRTL